VISWPNYSTITDIAYMMTALPFPWHFGVWLLSVSERLIMIMVLNY